jgi:hypothetical protein
MGSVGRVVGGGGNRVFWFDGGIEFEGGTFDFGCSTTITAITQINASIMANSISD